MKVGERISLKYSISPAGAKNADKFWFSDNNSIAYVADGILMGVGKGTTTVHLVTANLKCSCTVTVTDEGGGDVKSLSLSTESMTIGEGNTATLKAFVNPSTETITWTNSNPGVATYDPDTKTVTAIAAGTAILTATISDGISKSCTVTVKAESPEPPRPHEEGYSGEITVGAPLGDIEFVQGLLADFNTQTSSSVKFNVTQLKEDKGDDNLPQALSDGPDIFPFVSDQTVAFYQRNALYQLSQDDKNFIKDNMGQDALNAAMLNGTKNYLGYPYTGDNGYVMFYNKTLATQAGISDMSDITMEELLSIADLKDFEVDLNVTNAFYAAGTLMSYNNGKSLYELKMKPGGTSYTVTSTFDSEAGLKAAKDIRKFFEHPSFQDLAETPLTSSGVLATIVDCSKASGFKQLMGNDYGAAPLPYIDNTKTARYSNFLGYKFYGINPSKAAGHTETANAVARFLAGQYAQQKRFDKIKVKPTWLSLLETDAVKNEPHIKALVDQGSANTIKMTTVDPKLWSEAGQSVKDIKALSLTATDAEYRTILSGLDDKVYVE